jgi:chloride channel 6
MSAIVVDQNRSDPNSDVFSHRRHYLCPRNSSSFNDLGSLFLNVEEMAIQQLFHEPNRLSISSLFAFLIIFFFLAVWTYGAGVPSGLFVPCLSIGAAYGRIVGELLKLAGYSNFYPGSFALIGAASFLGGVVRMTISLCVILIESTNEISYGLPLMVVLMVAKWVGDRFNIGLYDIHVELKEVPFLEWESPLNMHRLKAEDIMEPNLKYLFPHTKVRDIVEHLRCTRHNAFPVVSVTEYKNLAKLPTVPMVRTQDIPIPASSKAAASKQDEVQSSKHSKQRDYRIASQQLSKTHWLSGAEKARLDQGKNLQDRTLRDRARTVGCYQGSASASRSVQADSRKTSSYPDRHGLSLLEQNTHRDRCVDSMSDEPEERKESEDDDGVFNQPGNYEELDEDRKVLMFHGTILRSQLVALLRNGIWVDENVVDTDQGQLSYQQMTEEYPRYSDIENITVPDDAMEKIIDVTGYMNPCPYTILPLAPLPYVFNLFRTMGLRHLVVVDSHGQAIGMITRHNLTHNFLEELKHKKNY